MCLAVVSLTDQRKVNFESSDSQKKVIEKSEIYLDKFEGAAVLVDRVGESTPQFEEFVESLEEFYDPGPNYDL